MIIKDKTLGALIFLIILGLILLISYIFNLASNIYSKPPAWIVSQGLYSSLAKQELALKESVNGAASLSALVKVATSSVLPNSETVMIGNTVYLKTGPLGQAAADIPQGEYKVSVVPVPGIDFTNVPKTILINKSAYEFLLGASEGSGSVKSTGQNFKKLKNPNSSVKALFVLKLFTDQNGNGAKDKEDQYLQWAGVTVKLTRI